MIYLLLSILFSSLISIAIRMSQGKAKSMIWMIAVNYLTCMLLSWGLMGFGNPFPPEQGLGAVLGMGTFNGFFYMLALILSQYSIEKNGVVLSSVFAKTGALLIPLLVSILCFREAPTGFQVVGFVLSIVSIFLLNYKKEDHSSLGAFKLALLALLFAEGSAGIMSKVFGETGNPALEAHFLFYTFAIALLFCLVVILFKKERFGKSELFYGLLVGIPNFTASRLMLKALERIPAVIVYPSRSVGTLVVIALAGTLFFRERLSKRQLTAMVITLVALVLLNL